MAAKASAGPKLYSYVVRRDTGFAPCPYGRYCTLAYCKPKIRKVAEKGDWVIGTGSVKNDMSRDLIYVMKVTKKIPFWKYRKKHKGRKDNRESGWRHKDKTQKETDRNGKFVLCSDKYNFYYFGKKGPRIPKYLRELIAGRGHKSKSLKPEMIASFIKWLKRNYRKPGLRGRPIDEEKRKANVKFCKSTPTACRN